MTSPQQKAQSRIWAGKLYLGSLVWAREDKKGGQKVVALRGVAVAAARCAIAARTKKERYIVLY